MGNVYDLHLEQLTVEAGAKRPSGDMLDVKTLNPQMTKIDKDLTKAETPAAVQGP